MSIDLQAKYNALLKMFNGEQPLGLPQEVMNSINRDLELTRIERAKRIENGAKVMHDTVRQMAEDRMRHVAALQALAEESQRLGLYDMELSK